MNMIIGDYHVTFVKDDQILDSVVITEDIVHKWKRDKVWGIPLKQDFEKAYDSVDHNFLMDMMTEMSFGDRWKRWMRDCISMPVLSVLINRSHMSQFTIRRGLCQGDPLSAFLFNMVVEGLSLLLKKAHDMDMIKGVTFGDNIIHISHLQYADDTMLFLESNLKSLLTIKRILRCFELASELRINFHKSYMVRIGKRLDCIEEWSRRLKCKKASLPLNYLGLPLGGRSNVVSFWKSLLARIENRLAS
ncbi:hypothetical protein Ddye_013973 [Dipteronia dyeriana]|uniref:Reverse transcriptase domain-containing protein n=1 Tax=Dipteronia dyeriana TaxID=168575 RepID=A0AAE0CK49_9ROSI|nr:hypothetical protein Ddye_013973 [Dipteronia dyeriana]